jgi:thiamine biosynthesis lipoprotein
MNRRRFLSLAAAFACAPHLAQAATWRGRALGAEVSVQLSGPKPEVTTALQEIPALLAKIEDMFSLYRDHSLINQLNITGHLTDTPQLFCDLVDHADTAHRQTNGLFDPTIQPLWQALATGQDTVPAQSQIGWDRVIRSGKNIRLAPGQALSFNGIAQGFATDLVADHLSARGFTRALINMGEHRALGGPYRLDLQDPTFGSLGGQSLSGAAMATSSPGALQLGARHHILAPDGRAPLWSTVSITAPSATQADALSTAAVFMTLGQLQDLQKSAGLLRLSLIDRSGNLRMISG